MSFLHVSDWHLEVAKGNIPGYSFVHKFGRNNSVANGVWELVGNLFADEVINLNGISASAATTTSFWRLHRGIIETAGAYATPWNDAAVIVENSGGGTDLLNIVATESQTKLGWYQWPTNYDCYVLSIILTVDSGKAADIRVKLRENFHTTTAPVSTIRTIQYFDGIKGAFSYVHETPDLLASGPAELWVEAQGAGADTEVAVDFELLLVDTTIATF